MLQNIDLLGLLHRKPFSGCCECGGTIPISSNSQPGTSKRKALIKCSSAQPVSKATLRRSELPPLLYLSCIVFFVVISLAWPLRAGQSLPANNRIGSADCRHHNHQSLTGLAVEGIALGKSELEKSQPLEQISRARDCLDCLAIPLVAIMGNKQVSGFILGPRRAQQQEQQQSVRMRPIAGLPNGYQGLQTMPPFAGPEREAEYQRQRYAYLPQNHAPEVDGRPFAPHPDDQKCPMRGPVTVCEQVEAYPADAILQKVERAKKVLKASYFNIDSFFSDERDHSNEPFEPSQTNVSIAGPNSGHASSSSKFTSQQSTYYQSEGGKLQNVPLEQEKVDNYESGLSLTSGAANPEPHNEEDKALLRRLRRSRGVASVDVNDEFVDLVERKAIRLSNRQYLDPQANISPASSTSSTSTFRHRQTDLGDNNELASERNQVKSKSDGELPRIPEVEQPASYALSRRRRAGYLRPARRSKRQASGTPEGASTLASSQPDGGLMSSAAEDQNQIEPACRARSIYISPRAALNDKKQWKYVVNAPERNPQVRQIIRVDVCENPFGPCSSQITIPFGFSSQCKQKYSKKKLLALDDRTGLLEVDTFFIPTCCVCQLVRDKAPSDPVEPDVPGAPNGTDNGSDEGTDEAGGRSFASMSSSSSASFAKTSPPLTTSDRDTRTTWPTTPKQKQQQQQQRPNDGPADNFRRGKPLIS